MHMRSHLVSVSVPGSKLLGIISKSILLVSPITKFSCSEKKKIKLHLDIFSTFNEGVAKCDLCGIKVKTADNTTNRIKV